MRHRIFTIIVVALSLFSCETVITDRNEATEPHVYEREYYGLQIGNPTIIKGENLNKISWESSTYFVAEVDDSNRIIPKHVGFSQITGSNGECLYVEVSPSHNDFDLPLIYYKPSNAFFSLDKDLLFGTYASSIRSLEKRTLDTNTSTLLVFQTGNNRSPYVAYFFEDGLLSTSGVIIDLAFVSNLPAFLMERCSVDYIDTVNYSAYFEHRNGSKNSEYIDYMGGLQYSPQLGGLLLAFMPYDNTKTAILDMIIKDFLLAIETATTASR